MQTILADLGPCSACGAPESGIALNNQPFCDRCADQRLAAVTGWPMLPRPPAPEIIVGPDRRRHYLRYRLLRMPGAVVALAEEVGGSAGSNFRLELRCDHVDDPSPLVEQIRTETRAAIAHPYLAVDERHGLGIVGDVVAGRLEDVDADDPDAADGPQVIVDGQVMSWAELGDLLKPYVGWSFELRLGAEPASRQRGDTLEHISVRPPTTTDQRAAARALRHTAGAYILDSSHYPTPEQWTHRHDA
jgi:hypothetical protein